MVTERRFVAVDIAQRVGVRPNCLVIRQLRFDEGVDWYA